MNKPVKPVNLGSNLGDEAAGGLPPVPEHLGQELNPQQQFDLLHKQMAAMAAVLGQVVQITVGQAQAGVKFAPEADQAALKPLVPRPPEKRIRIVLEDNDEIPPTGQFISVNGYPYILRAGEEADVPLSVIDVLDHAVKTVPVLDSNNSVIGWKDRLRFGYRVVREREREEEAQEA